MKFAADHAISTRGAAGLFIALACPNAGPDQRMSRMEALKSYTWNAAYAAFEEDSRGSLKVGKYADLIVLSKDITTIPEDDIPTAQVMYTVVGGKVRYQREDRPGTSGR